MYFLVCYNLSIYFNFDFYKILGAVGLVIQFIEEVHPISTVNPMKIVKPIFSDKPIS